MGHAKTVKNAAPGTREKIFHPQSRKADQIARSNLRKDKMSAAASIRRKRDAAQGASLRPPTRPHTETPPTVDIYTFFFHALPPTGTLTLPELHAVVTDAWLPRHSAALDAERAARRPGRPPSAREAALAAATDREAEEYRSGLGARRPSLSRTDTDEAQRWWT
jgi:translation machinery-associated protein 16